MAGDNKKSSASSSEAGPLTRVVIGSLIVVVAVALFVGWALASDRAREVPAPTRIVAVGDQVLVAVTDRLFRFGEEIGSATEVHLPAYVADQPLAAFGEQGVVIWHGRIQDTTTSGMRPFLPAPPLASAAGSGGLVRCSLAGACQPFPVFLPSFEGAFHLLWIDRLARLVVVDTERHRLLWFSHKGKLLAERKHLKYPNQPLYHDDALYVADTNNHRIVRFAVSRGELADYPDSYPVKAEGEHRWPVALARFAGSWWVLVGDNGLANARLQQYDDQWRWQRTVAFPAGADPVAMDVHNGRLVVTDLNGRRIWWMSSGMQPEPLPDIGPLGALLSDARAEHRAWDRAATGFVVLFLGLLPVGFWIAWRVDGKRHLQLTRDRHRSLKTAVEHSAPPRETVWLEHSRAVRLRWAPLVVLLLTIGLCGFLASDETMRKLWPVWLAMLATTGIAMGTIFFFLDAAAKSRIGVGPEGLTLVDHRNRRRTGRGAEVRYSRVLVAIGDVIVWVGNPQQPLYRREHIGQYLMPALKDAEPLGDLEQFGFILRSDHAPLRFALVVVALALVGCAAFVIHDLLHGL